MSTEYTTDVILFTLIFFWPLLVAVDQISQPLLYQGMSRDQSQVNVLLPYVQPLTQDVQLGHHYTH